MKKHLSTTFCWLAVVWPLFLNTSCADESATEKPASKLVKLPGMVVDLEKRCIDLEGTICLDKGYLELIACTQGSKEHESIVAVSAKAMHIHTALLLLGAKSGNPAMRRQTSGEENQWVNVPPRGDAIGVFLITKDKDGKAMERTISDFVVRSSQRVDEVDGEVITAPNQTEQDKHKEGSRFPHTFLFAGSQLRNNGPGPRQYLADSSGNVISIATFGDELLCLPFHQTRDNDALMWRVKPESLPATGTRVTLRLRPTRTKTPNEERRNGIKP